VLAKEIPSEANGLITRNADGTVDMTWPLYANVKWHDGEPFTSEDVCFTWKFVTSPGSQTYNREQYLGIEDCLMPDDTTVVFHWNGDYAYYAGLFEAVLPEHVLGELGTEEIVNHEPYNRGAATIGTGPFRFAQWKAGEYIRVVRNDDYWRGDDYPAIDEVVWSFIPDTNTRLNALKSGRYDWGRILPTQVEEAKRLPDYEVHLIESNSFMHFDLSLSTAHGKSLFDDVRVRRGLFHAIDREAIAAQLMQGTVRVAETPIATSSPYHSPEARASTYDPDGAKRLLDETGWTAGADGIRTKNGQRMSFTMLNRAGSQDRIAIAQVIQAQLKQIGVEVKFETLEAVAWTQRWRNGEWEAMVSAWFLPADPSMTNLYACDGANNMTAFCDAAFDEVLKASDRELAQGRRRPLMLRAQEMLVETARMLPLYYNVVPEVVSRRIEGYRGSGTNFGSFFNLYEWKLAGGG
jgi:peptide/nickel transport system substrate-binding protein